MAKQFVLSDGITLRFTAAFGTAAAVVLASAWLASVSVQIATVGLVGALTLGLLMTQERGPREFNGSDILQQSFVIAKDGQALRHHQTLARSLALTVEHGDPLFRALAVKRIATVASEADEIARGTIVYEDTETWRLAYEQLLRSPGLYLYRSVALVTSWAYWQDEPGRQSMRLNFEMQGRGSLTIERTVIIADEFWPANELLPLQPLRGWIAEQHEHGIGLRLVRLSSLVNEPDLQADVGIYGSRAVGIQELSPYSRTVRFILSFDFARVREAEDRWERLAVYATTYRDLLEQQALNL